MSIEVKKGYRFHGYDNPKSILVVNFILGHKPKTYFFRYY